MFVSLCLLVLFLPVFSSHFHVCEVCVSSKLVWTVVAFVRTAVRSCACRSGFASLSLGVSSTFPDSTLKEFLDQTHEAPESGEIIGKLHFSIEDRAKSSPTVDRGASVSSLEDFREVWSDASEFKSHLSKLLNQPQKLQEVLHARFRQVAQPNTSNISTAPCLSPDDLGNFIMAFAQQATFCQQVQ